MALSGAKLQELVAALAADFPAEGDLKQAVTFTLSDHVRPTRFDWSQDVESIAYEIVEWANSQGKVRELIEALSDPDKPNTRIAAISRQLPGWLDRPSSVVPIPTGGGRLAAALGGVVLLIIAAGIGYVIYQANAGQGAEPTQTPPPIAAGNVALSNLRVTESARGRNFLGALLNVDADCTRSNSCLKNALRQWLELKHADPSVVDNEEWDQMLNTDGLVFRVDAMFEELSGTECSIRWSVLDVEDGTASKVDYGYHENEPGFPFRALTPEDDDYPEQLELWISMPPRDGTFALKLEVFKGPIGSGATPNITESTPFTIKDERWVA